MEVGQIPIQSRDGELPYLDLDCLQLNGLFAAGQLVGRNSLNLLSRERRWRLLNQAKKRRTGGNNFFKRYINCLRLADWVAIGIVGVGCHP